MSDPQPKVRVEKVAATNAQPFVRWQPVCDCGWAGHVATFAPTAHRAANHHRTTEHAAIEDHKSHDSGRES